MEVSAYKRWIPWIAAAVSGALLIWGASAYVFWNDAGELSTAAADMGVPHPTGFSLWTSWARLLGWIPLGTLDFRFSLASVIPMAVSVGLLSSLLGLALERLGWSLYIGLDVLARGLLLPLALLSSQTVWYLATTPEVYSLCACVTLSMIWLLLQAPEMIRPAQKARALVVFTGLVPTLHITAVIAYVPALLVWLPQKISRESGPPKVPKEQRDHQPWELALLLILSGLGIFALVAAASRNPELNFGDPADLSGLWEHLSAQSIRSAFSGEGAMGIWAESWHQHWEFLMSDVGWVLLVLAFGSLVWLRRSLLVRSLWGVAVLDFAYSLFINPMGRKDLQTGMLTVFALVTLAVLAVVGVYQVLSRRFSQVTSTPAPPSGIAMALNVGMVVCLLGWSSWEAHQVVHADERWTVRHDPTPVQWFRVASSQMPPRSTLFSGGSDNLVSTTLALRTLEGRRPDLMQVIVPYAWWPSRVDGCVDCSQFHEERWRLLSQEVHEIERQGGMLSLSPPEQQKAQVRILALWLSWARSTPAVYWEPGSGLDFVAGRGSAGFLWNQLSGPVAGSRDIERVAKAVLDEPAVSRHSWSLRATSNAFRLAGKSEVNQERRLAWTRLATEIDVENGRAWRNLGFMLLKRGDDTREDVERSVYALRRASALRPYDSGVWRNLAVAFWADGSQSKDPHAKRNRKDEARWALSLALRYARTEADRKSAARISAGLFQD